MLRQFLKIFVCYVICNEDAVQNIFLQWVTIKKIFFERVDQIGFRKIKLSEWKWWL